MAYQFQADAEFLVNTETANGQGPATVARLSDGGFVVTWEDGSGTLGDASDTSIKAQRFDASGAPVGSEFLVNTETSSSQYHPAVTGLAGGGFVITWHDTSGTLGDGDTSIKAQMYDASGVTVGTEFLVNTTTANAQVNPTITGLANGGFVVTWQDVNATADDTEIRAQVFDASGAMVGSEFLVNTQTVGTQVEPTITALTNGGFVVTWYDVDGGLGTSEIKGQVFDSTGSKLGTEFQANTQADDGQWRPSVAGLEGGGFVVTWYDRSGTLGDSDGTSIKAQLFDASGTMVGSEFLVNTHTVQDQLFPTAAGLAGGGFVISWYDYDYTTSSTAIRAQVFDEAGVKAGAERLVTADTGPGHFQPVVSGLPDGSFVVSWWDFGLTTGDGEGGAVKAVVFSAVPTPATEGDDVIDGTPGNDAIDGLGGNDSINGLAGDDTITGGEGIDSITAGDGDDVITETSAFQAGESYDGGAGSDTLSGYGDVSGATLTGLEQLDVTAGRDLKATVEQLGTLSVLGVGAGSSITLANEGGVTLFAKMSAGALIYTSSAGNSVTATAFNDTIYGGAGDDYLFSRGGNDVLRGGDGNDGLDGGEGADSLYGGLGDDFYTIDQSGDKVVELSGQGIDTVYALVSYKASDNVENIYLGNGNIAGYGNALANFMFGNYGNNTLTGADGNDTLQGLEGHDKIDGGADHDEVYGGDGNDSLTGGDGSDLLDGGADNDQLNGGARWDTLMGGDGNDILDGGAENDEMYGDLGNDTYVVDHVGDRVYEYEDSGIDTVKASISYALTADVENLYLIEGALSGTGNGLNNSLNGTSGNNTLSGKASNDSLYGWDGNDSLSGGDDHDRLSGGNGNDTLTGGHGNDVLGGGAGTDDFVFSITYNNGHDHIVDFVHGVDRLVFRGGDYGFEAGHVLTDAEFTLGSDAVGSGAQFIWDSAAHKLWWDIDGAGGDDAFELAMISGGAVVTKDDLFFV